MNDVITVTQLANALSSIVDWRLECFHVQPCWEFIGILHGGERDIRGTGSAQLHAYSGIIESLQKVDGRLVDHFIAFIFLRSTELLEQEQDNSRILKVIYELMQFHESSVSLQPKSWSNSTNTSFTMATNILMKLNTEVNTDTMIQVELAEAFLHMSIHNTDNDQVRED